MRYVDTSVLLAFLVQEVGSDAAEALMTSDGDPLAVSSWSDVELMSALGVKLRTRQITEQEAQRAMDVYVQLVLPSLHRIRVDDMNVRNAAMLLDGWHTALRAGDSLHLAIASVHGATICTFDQGMAKAGKALGIGVQLLTIK